MTTTDDVVLHPDRHHPFEGIHNFRDLGGYPTRYGTPTRFGTVYRSATLHNATPADRQRLAALGVAHTIDLRSRHELERDGMYDFSAEGIERRHVPVSEDIDMSPEQLLARYRLYSIDVTQAYASILQRGRGAYRRVFAILAEDERPLAYHCSGGKDRAGVLSALILSVAGVERDLIVADYALTTRYLPEPPADRIAQFTALYGLTAEEFSAMHASAPDSMARTLTMIDRDYGSPEDYLRSIGVSDDEIAAVRARLMGGG
jgi:protein-tyrosine phosphatase